MDHVCIELNLLFEPLVTQVDSIFFDTFSSRHGDVFRTSCQIVLNYFRKKLHLRCLKGF